MGSHAIVDVGASSYFNVAAASPSVCLCCFRLGLYHLDILFYEVIHLSDSAYLCVL